MSVSLIFLLCFSPLIVLESIILLRGGKNKMLKVQAAVLTGFIVLIPITFFQTFILKFPSISKLSTSFFGSLFFSLFINGFFEEIAKSSAASFFVDNSKKWTVIFCIIIGLSFGCMETVVYTIHVGHVVFLRLFTTVLLHGACTAIASKFSENLHSGAIKGKYLLTAIFLHGFYNFFTQFPLPLNLFAYFCIATAVLRAIKLLKQD